MNVTKFEDFFPVIYLPHLVTARCSYDCPNCSSKIVWSHLLLEVLIVFLNCYSLELASSCYFHC